MSTAEAPSLLLKRARLLDLVSGVESEADVLVADGVIKSIASDLDTDGNSIVLDLAGRYLVPGLIDLHTHVYDGVADCVNADQVCLVRGTTTAVDAGTCGAALIDAFATFALGYRTRVLAWLNLSTIGLIDVSAGELLVGTYLNPDALLDAARRHAGFVIGIKARISTYAAGARSERVMSVLRQVADELSLPVMIHVGDTAETLDELVSWLRPADIVTHALTGRRHGILDVEGRVLDAIRQAQARGVVFDTARGGNHVSFPVLAKAVEQGFLPDTLSTDMNTAVSGDPDYGQTTIANYLIACGVPVHEAVQRMTLRPSHYVGVPVGSSLTVGGPADLAVLWRSNETAVLRDVDGRRLAVERPLTVAGSIKGGEVVAWNSADS